MIIDIKNVKEIKEVNKLDIKRVHKGRAQSYPLCDHGKWCTYRTYRATRLHTNCDHVV